MNQNYPSNPRKSSQAVLPINVTELAPYKGYRMYPYHSLGSGKIYTGFNTLGEFVSGSQFIAIDGYTGVFWSFIKHELENVLSALGKRVKWVSTQDYIKPEPEIEALIGPSLGTPGSVWGKRTTLSLDDFFNVTPIFPEEGSITIVYGEAAALFAPQATLLYMDLPKNELQYRMRAGSIYNLGSSTQADNAEMYKRSYFIDWVVLNKHKKQILKQIDIICDAQWPDNISWMLADVFAEGLKAMSTTQFRVRPWFEAGAWGGQWMKDKISGINTAEVNYAWSFEMIVPENGIVFESDNNLLEVSFDFLMYAQRAALMGKDDGRFEDEFPIRFDFLDTVDGGNLSIQCHPSLEYIKDRFGEIITQDETYYILDCAGNANVYLGFQDDIDPEEFRNVLEDSERTGNAIDVEKYVRSYKAARHDLFLIPNGTVHSAGAGNLVLEISATPYIFTFKMYDWVRLDLNGKPRPINIDHAFNNLRFDRKGSIVEKELISKQYVLEEGEGWKVVHAPTHHEHFYDVHRLEFDQEIKVSTDNRCHVLMLVEGDQICVVNDDGTEKIYYFAETFAVPAAAGSYTIKNVSVKGQAKVIKAFMK